ncbi:SSS sodium solute transporter superfamily [Candidatus Koribacter versatilis Ellin345]|uniref:SSS sodium solute transporter superfamily n=1 Tax=Koribacter versatilis (strain Ellin345) TaxID=204669 RepID=Q1IL97_KORVE|nr:sodium:solute symporter [Candidatus Koribacter versatilis]ABF42353.1 SSS sodium solute transporter superfamily [Candidatus Koribacter versatilis Ellin345]
MRFRKSQRTLKDYFLADRSIPWWALALSIVAAETSTLTLVSVPGLAYDTNFTFLQLAFGYLVGRVIICIILLPQYFKGYLFTAYQLIQRRFGGKLRTYTAGLFLITRAAAEGVRVYAVALVIGIALGPQLGNFSDFSRDLIAISIVCILTLIYTFEGGLAAVIWTDVIQTFIYIGGTIVGFFTIIHLVPGGWGAIHATAAAAGKFRVFDFSWDFWKTYTFWSGVIGGAFLTTASHGTDQLIVQRLLAARSLKDSRWALLASGVAVLLQFALFLCVGAMLWVFYHGVAFAKTDRIFPTFIVTEMPHLVSGLLIAAILAAAMSNLSAALNSLTSTSIIDFWLRLYPSSTEKTRMLLSRVGTIAWGLVLFCLAILSRRGGKVVELGLTIASVAQGAMLGTFLLGVLTKRANQLGTAIGLTAGFLVNIYIWQGKAIVPQFALPRAVPFPWYVAIGSFVTFAIGYSASLLLGGNHQPDAEISAE